MQNKIILNQHYLVPQTDQNRPFLKIKSVLINILKVTMGDITTCPYNDETVNTTICGFSDC